MHSFQEICSNGPAIAGWQCSRNNLTWHSDCTLSVDYYRALKAQRSDIARATQKLEILIGLLQHLKYQLENRKFRAEEKDLLHNITSIIGQCEEYIRELHDEMEKFGNTPTSSIGSIIKITGRCVAYPLRKSTLEKLDEAIEEMRRHLSLALQLLQQGRVDRTQDDIEHTKELMALMRASHISSNILNWFNPPYITTNFNEACRKRHPQTGLWFLEGPSFTAWLEKPASFLWVKGFAGCGKSTLCSSAIQHTFRRRRTDSQVGIGFFFFTFDDEGKQSAPSMLKALIV
jgi:ankyrin repeat domain-containing protein 50